MYKHILFATDFSKESQIAEKRAAEMARQLDAKLSVINVVEFYPVANLEGGFSLLPELEESMNNNAQQELDALKARIPIKLTRTQLSRGSPKQVIVDFAEDLDADLIVLGSHGRHGLGLLLGSTANGVLHIAKCDVLAVRVKD